MQFYPLEDRDFFSWTLKRFIGRSTIVWFIAAIAVAGGTRETDLWIWKTVELATLQWTITVLLALLAAALLPRISPWIVLGLYIALFAMVFAPTEYSILALPVLSALPTGWPPLLDQFIRDYPWNLLAPLGCIALLFLAAKPAVEFLFARIFPDSTSAPDLEDLSRVLRASDELEGESPEIVTTQEEPEVVDVCSTPDWQRQRERFLAPAFVSAIRATGWRSRWDWQTLPWIERFAGRLLSDQEKDIAEFLLGGLEPNWSSRWRVSVIAAGVASLFFALTTVPQSALLGTIAACVSVAAGVPLAGGTWMGLALGRISARHSPLFGCYPLEYRSTSRVMGKINVARAAVWAPIGLLLGAIIGWRDFEAPAHGTWIAFRVLLTWTALVPLIIAGHFSKGTNDTTNLTSWSLAALYVLLFPALFLIIVPLLIVTFAVPAPYNLLAQLFLGLVSLGAWSIYRRRYEGRIDLLVSPKA